MLVGVDCSRGLVPDGDTRKRSRFRAGGPREAGRGQEEGHVLWMGLVGRRKVVVVKELCSFLFLNRRSFSFILGDK